MITVRLSKERGHIQSDWLESFHTFSFGDYDDPKHMGFSHLRVINQDTIQPNQGFGMHSHHDMEIISYVTQGELAHKDNLGNGSVIKPGEIQRMSAGTGVRHSEFNHSKTEAVKLLQIWILPDQNGIEAGYEQKTIPKVQNQWILLAAPAAESGLVTIHQDAKLYVAYLTESSLIEYRFKDRSRCGWIQVIQGKIRLNDQSLEAGDGAAIIEELFIQIDSVKGTELLLFDLQKEKR